MITIGGKRDQVEWGHEGRVEISIKYFHLYYFRKSVFQITKRLDLLITDIMFHLITNNKMSKKQNTRMKKKHKCDKIYNMGKWTFDKLLNQLFFLARTVQTCLK